MGSPVRAQSPNIYSSVDDLPSASTLVPNDKRLESGPVDPATGERSYYNHDGEAQVLSACVDHDGAISRADIRTIASNSEFLVGDMDCEVFQITAGIKDSRLAGVALRARAEDDSPAKRDAAKQFVKNMMKRMGFRPQ